MKSYTRVSWAVTLMVGLAVGAAMLIDPMAHAFVSSLMQPEVVGAVMLADATAINAEDIKAALKAINDKVKEYGEQALAEAKKHGDASEKVKTQVDELLASRAELKAQVLDLEQKVARGGPEKPAVARTAGEMVSQSDAFKDFMAKGGIKSTQSGFIHTLPRAALTSIGTTNTTTVGVNPDMQPGVIPGTSRRLTIRDLLMPGTTESNMIQFVKETGFTNSAATVSESSNKPESSLVYTLTQSAVVTVAHWIKASKQILDDFKALGSMIDARLRYGLKLVEENQLLKGSGVGNNLNGIYTQATAFVAPIVVTLPTKIDQIRLMILQAELAEYPSTGIVLHPSDWAAIELTKDTTRAYLFANPQGRAQAALWGLPVVSTQAMTVDTALVGAFQLGAQIFDREEANVVIASENSDDFIKNMITIRCEERLALAVYRPAAFVKQGDLSAS